jgi:hypothetical protein
MTLSIVPSLAIHHAADKTVAEQLVVVAVLAKHKRQLPALAQHDVVALFDGSWPEADEAAFGPERASLPDGAVVDEVEFGLHQRRVDAQLVPDDGQCGHNAEASEEEKQQEMLVEPRRTQRMKALIPGAKRLARSRDAFGSVAAAQRDPVDVYGVLVVLGFLGTELRDAIYGVELHLLGAE